MNISRRRVLVPLLAMPFMALAADRPAPREEKEIEPFTGSWFVTSAITSLILSIEAQGEVLFLFIEGGAFSILRTTWKLAPGGLIIEGMPRIRLWPGGDPHALRAEMEPLPDDLEVSVGFRRFPRKFFMRRVANARLAGQLDKRPLPEGWDKPAPDATDEVRPSQPQGRE